MVSSALNEASLLSGTLIRATSGWSRVSPAGTVAVAWVAVPILAVTEAPTRGMPLEASRAVTQNATRFMAEATFR